MQIPPQPSQGATARRGCFSLRSARGGDDGSVLFDDRLRHTLLEFALLTRRYGLGKQISADWVRKWLSLARDRFAALLVDEVSASLREPDPDSVMQELIDLGLFGYCKVAVDRWRKRLAEEG